MLLRLLAEHPSLRANVDRALVICPMHVVYAVRDVRYHSVAALALLIWHALLTFDDEVRYVWPMRNKNPFKWTYLYLRYVVIVAHVMHNCLMEQLVDGTNPPMVCDAWRGYVLALTQCIATPLELLLASRVFALYNRSRRVGLLLSILMLTEIGGSVRMLWLRGAMEIYGTCLLVLLSASGRYQTIIGFIVHCTLVGLTLFKYCVASRAGWGRTPLVSLVVRDAGAAYTVKLSILVGVLLLFDLQRERGVAAFFWSTALGSVTGCYLVVSMERLARGKVDAPEPVLTSELGMNTYGSGIW